MLKNHRIELSETDLGQALDGLRVREESWRDTARYLREGIFWSEPFLCEECSDWEEAEKIADHYQRIIASIERQVAEQGET